MAKAADTSDLRGQGTTRCFSPSLDNVVRSGLPPVLYPSTEDSVKVKNKRGIRRWSRRSALIGAAVCIVALLATGRSSVLDAFAQMTEPEGVAIDDVSQKLAPDAQQPDADVLRTPSGLADLEAKSKETRTATTIKKAAGYRAPQPTKASRPSIAAGSGKGWKSARVSWYGPGFYGKTMAGGGVLTPGSMVVAHRSLPFGTRVELSYKGRTCVAVVRDRGPFSGGRTFDLGPGTARALGFSGVGTVRYRIL